MLVDKLIPKQKPISERKEVSKEKEMIVFKLVHEQDDNGSEGMRLSVK